MMSTRNQTLRNDRGLLRPQMLAVLALVATLMFAFQLQDARPTQAQQSSSFREGSNPTGTCSNADEANDNDGDRADCTNGEQLFAGGFGLDGDVPPGGWVYGFVIRINGRTSNTSNTDRLDVDVSCSGGAGCSSGWTTANIDTPELDSTSSDIDVFVPSNYSEDSSGDEDCETFDRSWTTAELSGLQLRLTAESSPSTLSIDDVDMKVCWALIEADFDEGATTTVGPSESVSIDVDWNPAEDDTDWSSTRFTVNGVQASCDTSPSFNNVDRHQTVSDNNNDVTAPASPGTYDVLIQTYDNNNCTALVGERLFQDAIVVEESGATLTLIKEVIQDDGGNDLVSAWQLSAVDDIGFSGASGVSAVVEPGTYTLSETGPALYRSLGWGCVGQGGTLEQPDQLTLVAGADVTCTVTNDDLALATLVGDASCVAPDDSWSIEWSFNNPNDNVNMDITATDLIDGGAGPDPTFNVESDIQPAETVTATTNYPDPGNPPFPNQDPTLTVDYTIDGVQGSFDVEASVTDSPPDCIVVCEESLEDSWHTVLYEPEDEPERYIPGPCATLSLDKVLPNDDGGISIPSDWDLTADGPEAFSGLGGGGFLNVTVPAGDYDLMEVSDPLDLADKYVAGDWDCGDAPMVDGDTVTIDAGADVSCSITNDDIPGTLVLTKTVINDDGGQLECDDFGFQVDGGLSFTPFEADCSNSMEVDRGNHTLDEDGVFGYTASDWDCDKEMESTNVVFVDNAETVTCTITNNDDPGVLNLVKNVINDHNGPADANDWQLSANGDEDTVVGAGAASGQVDAGVYALDELPLNGQTTGYTTTGWTCIIENGNGGVPREVTPGLQPDQGAVFVGNGEEVTCTITNNDPPVVIRIVKEVVSQDFSLLYGFETPCGERELGHEDVAVCGNLPVGSYEISEVDTSELIDIDCSGGGGADISLANGSVTFTFTRGIEVTCTFTNDPPFFGEPDPDAFPQLGGQPALQPVEEVAGVQQQAVESVGIITPPSTGDAGLAGRTSSWLYAVVAAAGLAGLLTLGLRSSRR
jgi:hypothetical protein